MAETPNHGYNIPEAGTQDWHEPVNANFEALGVDIEIRDAGGPTEGSNDYDPVDGAKYLDTDAGTVYLGDGNSWTEAFSFGGGGIESLSGGDGIDPTDIGDGDTLTAAWGDASVLDTSGAIADWSGAADLDASGAVTASFIGTLSGGDGIAPGTVGDGDTLSVAWGDAADLASDGSVDQLSGALTGGQALTDIAGTNLSIDSNGQLNASGGSGGGIESLSGGDGIDPTDIGDGDTLTAAWGDAGSLDASGDIADFSAAADLDTAGAVTDWSGAADLDASGAVTTSFIGSLSGGNGIDPGTVGDGDTLSVAWGDATDLASDGSVEQLSGALTGGQSLTDIAGTNLSIDSNGQLNASGGSGGGISSLTGGGGISPDSIGDGDTLTAAWGDAASLDASGDIADFSAAADLDASGAITADVVGGLTGGDGITPDSIGDGDTLSVAWGDGANLGSNGQITDFSEANDLDADGNVTNGGGGISSLTGGDGIDPDSIGDSDTLSVAWGDGADLALDGSVDQLSGSLTGGQALTDIAGTNLSIDSNGQLNASGGSGGISSLSGGDGITPDSIGDGDTLTAAWADAGSLDASGDIADFSAAADLDTAGAVTDWSGAADLDASGALTVDFVGGLTGGDGISPDSIGDGDTLSVAWGDGTDLAPDGSVDQLSGSLTGGQALTDIAGTNLSIDSNGQLNASGSGGGISSLSGGNGITPDSIGDGDTLSVAPGDIAGTFLSTDGSNNLTVNAGGGLENDSAGNLQTALGSALGFDGSNRIAVTTDTVTVAGNAVSLGGSTAIGHADLSGVSENQHHSKNHDHTETGISAVPNAGLANSSVTVSPGNGLQSGGQVSLGGSTTLDVNPADVAGTGLTDDGASNLEVAWEDANDLDASGNVTNSTSLSGGDGISPGSITDGDTLAVVSADIAGTFLSTDGSNDLTVDAGNGLENDGSGNLQAALGNALGFDGTSQIAVTTDTVTVAGNSVSLGGSTALSHADISGVSSDQHHSKDHDHTEADITAVPNAGLANSSVTVSSGNGLQSGGSVSLGGSTTLDVNPADVAGTGLADDGNSNLEVAWEDANDLDASGSVTSSVNLTGGSGISPDSITDGDTLSVAPGDIAGTALEPDGSDLAVSASGISSTELASDAATSTEIAPDAVTTSELASGAVTTSELASGAVTTSELASGAVTTSELASGAVTSSEIADGTIDTADIGQNSASDGHVFRWNGTSWVTGFPGTLDSSTPFELLAGGTSTLRLDPNGLDEPNVVTGVNHTVNSGTGLTVGGGSGHTIGGNHPTVAGGESNEVSTDYATVAGGINNEASGNTAAVGGGSLNKATGQQATVAGGNDNTAGATHATVAGGQSNEATGLRAAVSGGRNNLASGEHATVGGGERNTAQVQYATIGGGGPSEPDNNPDTTKNIVYDNYGTIAGGGNNQAGSDDGNTQDPTNARYATVGGGRENKASGRGSTVSGGLGNEGTDLGSTVSGGFGHAANGQAATVGGGQENGASESWSTVAGGTGNDATDFYATIGGGEDNTAQAEYATIAGGGPTPFDSNKNFVYDNYGTIGGGGGNQAGLENSTGNTFATIGGGRDSIASGQYSTVPGGRENRAEGDSSFAAGSRASAASNDSFVWNDGTSYHDIDGDGTDEGLSSDESVASNGNDPTGQDTFSVSAQGGVRFITGTDQVTYLTDASAGWTSTSTRTAKTNIEPVDPEEALAGVDSMAVSTWEYTDEDGDGKGTTHIGPMAEEFHEAFDVGSSDEHINSINADGVAFAAIQGLSAELDRRDERIADLEAESDRKDERIADLEAENEQLREQNADLEARLAAVEEQLGLDGASGTTDRGVADD